MKKLICICLALCLCLSLVACGSDEEVERLEKKLEKAEAKIEELQAQLNAATDTTKKPGGSLFDKGGNAKKLNLGDSVKLEFVEFTLQSASWSDTIKPTVTDSFYSYKADEENESYFWLCGTLKNIAGESYDVEDIVAEIVFNDKYTYQAKLIADDGGSDFYGNQVKPLGSVKFYIYASVPDEVRDIYTTATVKFGFNSHFGGSSYDDFEDCEYLYQVNLNP